MLTSTPTLQAVLDGDVRPPVWQVKIYPRNANGTENPTPVVFRDRVISITFEDDFDRRNAICTITLDNTDGKLSPKKMDSEFNIDQQGQYSPLIYPNRRVEVFVGFITEVGEEYWQIFSGVTGDEIDLQSVPGQVTLSVRDRSKVLQDRYIFLSPSYDYVVAEQVIQDLLQRFATTTEVFEYEPTNYMIQHYQVQDMNLWDALQRIADLMGWILRYDNTGKLQFYKNDMTRTTADLVLDEDEISRETIRFSDADIRNDIWIKIQTTNSDLIIVNRKDQASINQFGKRYMEVDRGVSSFLNTYEQAVQLAEAILDDLAWIHDEDEVTMGLYPPIQAGDFVAIHNSKTSQDGDTLYRVTSVTHNINKNTFETRLRLRAYKQRDVSTDPTVPKAPTGVSATQVVVTQNNYSGSGWSGSTRTRRYPKISWSAVTQNTNNSPITDLGGYTIYRAESQNGNYIAIGSVRAKDPNGNNQTSYIDYSVKPPRNGSKTYWYRVRAWDTNGNLSDFSTAVSALAQDTIS